MFEKSLLDLIRGLRHHKGNEKEYIQNCLKECRSEIQSLDMDVKATALLKLLYLEMVGHDMSWAAFHVLEVMSSAKYHQKRVGYLGAVQTFRPNTDVVMLATNLLKKDLTSASMTTISLPIATLPHIITPSLAMSVVSDLLPRLGHSNPAIRKKTIVTLYRLALVYPETLRAAWPKIKERLMDKDEDPSVTAAVVNVVCELGWRRPYDFLPLAPRLFELLVDGGNNWMAIKLIKLFATLTPLEPRLARKLLPPLTDIIRTTPAMSLLYECINGIIQGGILGSGDDVSGTEEIASLCVSKLRSMILVDGDPNLKYVALLAFNRIVTSHPFLVAQQEDVILECIDSPDITIRIKALDLVQGMVSSENLVSIVSRLMRQLKLSSASVPQEPAVVRQIEFRAEPDDEPSVPVASAQDQPPPLPEDYKIDVIGRILSMCAKDNYSNLGDFDWYIDILTQLVRTAPPTRLAEDLEPTATTAECSSADVSERIGNELRNVAVKVKAVRPTAARAADSIISHLVSDSPLAHPIASKVLKPTSWIVSEYGSYTPSPDGSLDNLLHILRRALAPDVLAACLHAVVKLFALVVGDDKAGWTAERKARTSLLTARIVHLLETLGLHPSLEVQERAVEFTELLKLALEAVSGQPVSTDQAQQDAPLLLTQAIPSLFRGWELNSVAPGAQRSVPHPGGLDLDEPIHPNLAELLSEAGAPSPPEGAEDEFEVYYHQRAPAQSISSLEPAITRLQETHENAPASYQQSGGEDYLDPDILARRKAERLERNKDDPFYIPAAGLRHGTATPIHEILSKEMGNGLDIDSIPIMQLDLDKLEGPLGSSFPPHNPARPSLHRKPAIAADETLGGSGVSTPHNYESENNSDGFTKSRARKLKHSLLQVDSSHIGALSLDGGRGGEDGRGHDLERQQRAEAEMANALREVEKRRLEMQRARERVQVAQGVDVEGIVVKKKKKKRKKAEGVVKETKKNKQAAVPGGEESRPLARPPAEAAVAKGE